MKVLNKILVAFFCASFVGCQCPEDGGTYNRRLAQQYSSVERELRKMVIHTSQTSKITGKGFFIFGFGGADLSGKSETVQTITFAYKDDDGSYRILTVPLDKCRIRLGLYSVPKVRVLVEWPFSGRGFTEYDTKDLLTGCEILVQEKDWPVQVQLPLNQ